MNTRAPQPAANSRSLDGIHARPGQTGRPAGRRPRFAVRGWRLVGAVAVVLVIVAILAAWQLGYIGSLVKSDRYQAVFLTNGQVYYGKMHGYGGKYLRLSDVYYLKAQSATEANSPSTQQLVKLGSEIHGPDTEMMIRTDQILFFENLRPDSAIVKAIQDGNSASGTTIQR